MAHAPLSDWVQAPNITGDPDTYERENKALRRDGRLDEALLEVADIADRDVLDIGCGTGFWLPELAGRARSVVGVEPDPELRARAAARCVGEPRVRVARGSAEHLPLPDHSIDVVHARFAYFFGPGAERGLAEVRRVLRPGGTFIAVDNSWEGGDFAVMLEHATTGNAAMDPGLTDAWWRRQGARRVEVDGGWHATSPDELERILRLEFPGPTVDRFLASRPPSPRLAYRFALFVVHG